MKTERLAALSLFFILMQHCEAAPFSAGEQEAAATARAYRDRVQQALSECASQFAGKGGEYFQFLWHFWDKQNEGVYKAVGEIWPTVPEAARSASERAMSGSVPASLRPPEGIAPSKQYERCDALAKQAQSGTLNFSMIHPTDSSLLTRVVASRAEFRNVTRNADFTIGCMKREWNGGNHNASSVRSMCECQTDVLARSASDEEIGEWLREMAANRGSQEAVAQRTPWLQKALPAIAACKPQAVK